MAEYPPRRRQRKNNSRPVLILIAVLCIALAGLVAVAVYLGNANPPENPTNPTTSSVVTDPSTQPTTSVPPTTTEPPVVKEASATFSAVGDMLMHMPVVNTGRNGSTGEYNFDSIFRYFSDYVQSADFAAGNLETTLAGSDFKHYNGNIGYSGYPQFNCPDEIIDGMKTAGFDMVLTANNHSYDTQTIGLHRTVQTILDRNLQVLGTKPTPETPNFVIVERNGIEVALSCYTYEDISSPDQKGPNGHLMTAEDAPLINSFDYANLPLFYAEIESNLAQMEEAGADAYILFLHWGYEYHTVQNATQSAMAQALCDLGVDVIVGGHPHVVQPVELLTSTKDETQKTVCLYSMGNAVSNQRLGNLSNVSTAHTEDGVMFSVTFSRYSDGTVILERAEVLPTWVKLGTNQHSGRWEYNILPLDKGIEDWKTQFGLSDTHLANAEASYERTMAIVGEGLTAVNTYLSTHVAEVEQLLGVA